MSGFDTIFAPASGAGRAAVAVVRVSGPAASAALAHLAGALPRPRTATVAALREGAAADVLDHALVLWFPAPRSFTGEDVAELHLHGGRAVVAAVLRALDRFPGCRPAEPGEFTRRAFRNGKMSLAAVEGLADLIDAETDAQRRQARRQIEGALERWVGAVRKRLVAALALVQGAIDFAEEDDLATPFRDEVADHVRAVAAAIDAEIEAAPRAEKLRHGLVIALAGAPNVGKSSLLNALARREAAIVSVHAGTTRDPVEVHLDLDGLPVTLVDTAGLRPTDDPVEREGIARTLARTADADLVLWLDDGFSPSDASDALRTAGALWRVRAKADLPGPEPAAGEHAVSAVTGAGLPALLAALARFADGALVGDDGGAVTRLRHRATLTLARDNLTPLLDGEVVEGEIVAERLRDAARHLQRLVGAVGTEDVLGAIFARFCVGK